MKTKGLTERDTATLAALATHLLPEAAGLPGADRLELARRLQMRSARWDRAQVQRIAALVRAWDASPLASKHLKRFTSLSPEAQSEWVESSYRSKVAWRRLLSSALKQLLFIEWASTPAVEDELGYDYRCRRDDEVHGADRFVHGDPAPVEVPPEPRDYSRLGPAVAQKTIPISAFERGLGVQEANSDTLETHAWPDIQDGALEVVDAVVIGSGAGGAVLAATLAELGANVLVLEEGDRVNEDDLRGAPFDRFQKFCRDNGMTQVLGRPPIPLPIGKVVGGTTVVNSGTCFRAPERVLRQWEAEFGVVGARHDELAEHYDPIEEFLNVRPVPWELLGPNGMAAHKGATALGLSGGPLLRNIRDCHGCGQCAFGCPTNAKQAMHVSYLPRAVKAGARVFARCRVDRIDVEEDRATGVHATLLDGERRPVGTLLVKALNVIVCAGAIHTPVLLEKSGIPDPSRQTGHNLRIHPATGVGAWFDDDLVNWKGTLQSYYIDALFDTHEVMFEATTTVPGIGAGSVPGIGAAAMEDLASFRKLATLGFYVSDTSAGRVRSVRGEAVATYRMNELDAHRMGVAIAVGAEIMLAAGAKRVYPGLPGIDAISAREDLEQLRTRRIKPEHLRLTAFHPMGTVRMGSDPAISAVDAFGHHHEVDGLWVADASVFPSCVGVNPQMTIMAFARRTAQKVAGI
jgi:NAD-dependent dihydropyrimidine dehydrogenase PreA subunit